MSGYYGYSMSNNAVEAYNNGEKPISKWTKTEIINVVTKFASQNKTSLQFDLNKLKKISTKELKDICLYHSSWHHTSNHYNHTEFYALDIDRIKMFTNDFLDEIIATIQSEEIIPLKEETWRCSFLEWSGSRKHPKAKRLTEEGIIKGNWFYRKDGSKKKITANGFELIQKIN